MPAPAAALLVLDMQNDGVKVTHAGDERTARVVQTIAGLIDWARRKEIPIVYSRVCYRDSYVDAHPHSPARQRHNLKEDDPGSQVIDELRPRAGDFVVVKRRTGAFYGTDLEIILRGLGARSLLFTGTSTGRAVESTVREAHSRDFENVVVSDACYARNEELHQAALPSMGDWFAEIKSAEEAQAPFG